MEVRTWRETMMKTRSGTAPAMRCAGMISARESRSTTKQATRALTRPPSMNGPRTGRGATPSIGSPPTTITRLPATTTRGERSGSVAPRLGRDAALLTAWRADAMADLDRDDANYRKDWLEWAVQLARHGLWPGRCIRISGPHRGDRYWGHADCERTDGRQVEAHFDAQLGRQDPGWQWRRPVRLRVNTRDGDERFPVVKELPLEFR